MITTLAGFRMGVLKPDPPIMAYYTTGQFSISNYNPTLIYVATLITGSGTATLNTSTGRYTLSGADSRFSVVANYGSGAPNSDPDFMERNAYSYSCRSVDGGQSCSSCNCRLEGGNCGCSPPDPNTGGCPPGSSPNGQCGCGGSHPCMYGSIGTVVCDTCCSPNPPITVCDVFIDESSGGYTNSGTEWYKVS